MQSWKNGDLGKDVRTVIESNFKILEQIATPCTKVFQTTDWLNGKLSISLSEHGKSLTPNITVYMKDNNGNYEQVETEIKITPQGTITISSDLSFNGVLVVS